MIIQEWNNKKIHIRDDRYVCATDIAKATNKSFEQWMQVKGLEYYCLAPNYFDGEFLHPSVAKAFASWCDQKFFIDLLFSLDYMVMEGYI